jgi:hypothetical protein
MPPLAIWQWLLGALCAFFVGVAKTGVPGLGILVVPLMVIAVGDARASAGWLLPLLCAADLFAVFYYRRHTQTRRLFNLVPWVAVGMAGGAIALGLEEALLRRLVGTIVLCMIGAHVWRKRQAQPSAETLRHSALFGAVAGFATMVANAAGPVMNVYLLSKRLPKEAFIATGAWFFLVINLSKLPVYAGRGMISAPSLGFDAVVLPALLAGAVSGRALFLRIPQKAFEAVVLTLTAIATLLLFLPALRR